jgi:geranylgeranyl reductase
MESVDFLVVGCGPAGATAAREAARAGLETVVLEKDAVVGALRVCAAGLRPGFCDTFDLPREVVHYDTTRLALFDVDGTEHSIACPGHTSTREELDGTMARLAQSEGAQIRTQALFRSIERDGERCIVEYADRAAGERRRIAARHVFIARGATALAQQSWDDGLMTTLQYRVYLDRPAADIAYRTLELHYYPAPDGRVMVAWMFPKRDHLAIGLGLVGKLPGVELREELDAFTERVRARLYAGSRVLEVKTEGHLLYGGLPLPGSGEIGTMVGGTAAGLVDATNGEGIFEAAMSGRMAAAAVAADRAFPARATARYARALAARFARRLSHRVNLMHFLERRPVRFGMLFEQLAGSRHFSDALQKESHERTIADRCQLYLQALKFALRAARA